MKAILTTLLLLIGTMAFSQFTVTSRYFNNNSEGIDLNFETDNTLNQGFELDLGYWFRLKNKRLEFIPEVGYSLYSGATETTASGFNVNLNVLIYPLDFHNDCNSCPTFSKEGGTIKKGFHWIITPGWSNFNLSNPDDLVIASQPVGASEISTFRIGAGAGLDIGVTNLLALTPFVMFNIGEEYEYFGIGDVVIQRYRQLHFGLRATLRLDKDKW